MTTTPAAVMHHGVARELGIEIIDGEWAVDSPRTLDDLQTRFGVSRTVAREASRQLEAMGLGRSKRRLGIVALPMSQWNVLDPLLIEWRLNSQHRDEQIHSLTQLRLAIEPAAAAGTAANASIHTRARLLPLAAELRRTGEAGNLTEFLAIDIEFHRLLLESCGNEMFAALGVHVAAILEGRTHLGLMPPKPRPEALDGHEAVAEAVFRGDPVAARTAMQQILHEVSAAFADAGPAGGTSA